MHKPHCAHNHARAFSRAGLARTFIQSQTGRRLFVTSLLGVLLAGCGGGGGGSADGGVGASVGVGVGPVSEPDTLYVTAVYPITTLSLFQSKTVVPYTTGFQGHTPSCSLIGGAVPPGMQLNADCSVTGAASKPGSYSFTVRVGASDAKGTIESPGTITVNTPTLIYQILAPGVSVGSMVDKPLYPINWSPTDVPNGSWSYQMIEGSLPPGLVFDPVSGKISGVIAATGLYAGKVLGTLTTPYGTYTPPEPTVFFFNILN